MAPDPNATGSPAPLPGDEPGAPGRETAEQEAAWRRGEARPREAAAGTALPGDPYRGLAGGVAPHAFAALAENVRDYAIFLLDPDGIITFWGEGARLIKWWTRDHPRPVVRECAPDFSPPGRRQLRHLHRRHPPGVALIRGQWRYQRRLHCSRRSRGGGRDADGDRRPSPAADPH